MVTRGKQDVGALPAANHGHRYSQPSVGTFVRGMGQAYVTNTLAAGLEVNVNRQTRRLGRHGDFSRYGRTTKAQEDGTKETQSWVLNQ